MASECSICLHTFNRPKLLPCFHTFCEGCLASIVSQTSQAQSPATDTCFPCPLCRTLTDVPQAGVCAFLVCLSYVDNIATCVYIYIKCIQMPENIFFFNFVFTQTLKTRAIIEWHAASKLLDY